MLRRCWEKPRGYAGDFLMMEALYRRKPEGQTPLELWMDSWALELPASRRCATDGICWRRCFARSMPGAHAK
ncbi:hypothetical protein ACN28S_34090 [Cystobacter fuscus]